MDEFLRSHPLVAWVGAGLAFVIFVILLLHMVKILIELRRRLPSGERSRQLRLGFVENFDLDGERQLLLVRRDNVEHLLLIGGPNDVLVESGIVRAEVRAPRGGFEAPLQGGSAPSALALALGAGQENGSPPARPDPLPAALDTRPEVRFEPKPAPQVPHWPQESKVEPKAEPAPEPKSEPKSEPLAEIDLEEELKAALEASQLNPPEEPAPPPVAVEPVPPPPPPPPPPPSRFNPPPRPIFRAPLPPRSAPAPGAEQPSRPRFVIPPLARRNPAPIAPEPPPPAAPFVVEPPPPSTESPAPEAEAAHDPFAPHVQPETRKPEPEPHQPPPRADSETLESLEEEMAKLLGRPPRP